MGITSLHQADSKEINTSDKSGHILTVLYTWLWWWESHALALRLADVKQSWIWPFNKKKKWQRLGPVCREACGGCIPHKLSWGSGGSKLFHSAKALIHYFGHAAAGFFPVGATNLSKQPPCPGTKAKVQCCGCVFICCLFAPLRPSCWACFQLFWLKQCCFPFELNIFISLQSNLWIFEMLFLCVCWGWGQCTGTVKRSLRKKKNPDHWIGTSPIDTLPTWCFPSGRSFWRIVSVLHLSRSNLLPFIFNCTFTFWFSCTIFGRKLAALSCQPQEIFKS